jgi:hypothetical protein
LRIDTAVGSNSLARLYLKLVVRTACVVVSFHEDEGEADEEP